MKEQYIIKQLLPGIWRFTDKPEHPYVDIYLIEGEKKALLVDSGDSKTDLIGYIRELTDKPLELMLTHGHSDHTANMDQFDKVYMNRKDYDLPKSMFYQPMDQLKLIEIKGEEVIDLGNLRLEVIAIPGHTPGSMALLDRQRQLLFTGDSIGSGMLWMQLPGALPLETYVKELAKLEQLVSGMENLKIFVGHSVQHDGDVLGSQYVKDVHELADHIVAGKTVGEIVTNPDIKYGGRLASNGLMKEFVYNPDNVYIK